MQANTIHPKVVAGVGGGATVTILVWVAGLFGLDMPEAVAAALAVLGAAVAGYLRPSMSTKVKLPMPKLSDGGYAGNEVLWTVFLILAIVALLVWLF